MTSPHKNDSSAWKAWWKLWKILAANVKNVQLVINGKQCAKTTGMELEITLESSLLLMLVLWM